MHFDEHSITEQDAENLYPILSEFPYRMCRHMNLQHRNLQYRHLHLRSSNHLHQNRISSHFYLNRIIKGDLQRRRMTLSRKMTIRTCRH